MWAGSSAMQNETLRERPQNLAIDEKEIYIALLQGDKILQKLRLKNVKRYHKIS